jgi:DNA polymerase III gamma/tau subunit
MSTATFAFPVGLAEKYRPRRIADFVGLVRPKKILLAFSRKPHPSAWLFVGPTGVGKTTMALALAEELGAEVEHIPSQKCTVENVEDAVRRCWYVPLRGGFHIVIVDEADAMSNAAQLALLSKLDATAFPPQTIFVFTSNATDRLEPRFLSRCREVEFSSYGMAGDIAAFLERVWHQEGGNGNAPDFIRLAKEARNNLRDCLMRLEVELLAAQD